MKKVRSLNKTLIETTGLLTNSLLLKNWRRTIYADVKFLFTFIINVVSENSTNSELKKNNFKLLHFAYATIIKNNRRSSISKAIAGEAIIVPR